MPRSDEQKDIAVNRRARHDYFIEETYEAGLVLQGQRGEVAARGRALFEISQVDELSAVYIRRFVIKLIDKWGRVGSTGT